MIDGLSLALTLGSLAAALAVAAAMIGRRFRRASFDGLLVVLQAGLVIQAVLDVAGLVGGHRPGETATHLAYLVTSLVVLPLAAAETRRDDAGWSSGWSGGLLIVALVVLAVLVLRLQTTWRSG